MSVLYFKSSDYQVECRYVSQLDTSFFSLKNQYTSESGNTIIYPIKMRKTRISFTAELQGNHCINPDTNEYVNDYLNLMNILENPEFECLYKSPESDELISKNFIIASDISVTKIMSENGIEGGLYAVSATLEEV